MPYTDLRKGCLSLKAIINGSDFRKIELIGVRGIRIKQRMVCTKPKVAYVLINRSYYCHPIVILLRSAIPLSFNPVEHPKRNLNQL